MAQAGKPRQPVAQGGQLGLQLALVGGGTAGKDLQNQHGAVDDLHLQGLFQIADLAARQLAVKNGGLGAQILADQPGFSHPSLAQHSGHVDGVPLLQHLAHRLHAVGFGQSGQFLQAALGVVLAQVHSQQHHLYRGLHLLLFGHRTKFSFFSR